MTDKQIIIDGVDVSGCDYIIPPRKQCPNKPMPYAKETSCFACKEHNTKLNFCKNNPNCYYKQLQRAEQKLEKIKYICKNVMPTGIDEDFFACEVLQKISEVIDEN